MPLTDEQCIENAKMLETLTRYVGDDRREQLTRLMSDVGDRLATAPASSTVNHPGCFTGGHLEDALTILRFAKRVQKDNPDLYGEVPRESVVFTSLFGRCGRAGWPGPDGAPYYIPTTESWRTLQPYTYDQSTPPLYDMTIAMLTHYAVPVRPDEVMAIALMCGEDVKFGRNRTTPLASLMTIATTFAERAMAVTYGVGPTQRQVAGG